MVKKEIIDGICLINTNARPDFLANFSEEDLREYLEHLTELEPQPTIACG